MTAADERRGTLQFGESGSEAVPEVELPSARVPPVPRLRPRGRRASTRRIAARRARQRRRAAERRSTTRLRAGSPILLAFLVICGLTLLMVDQRTAGSAFDGPRRAVLAVLGPLQSAAAEVAPGAATDIARLRAENERLQAELATQQAAAAQRAAELSALLGVIASSGHAVVAADVTALNFDPDRSLTAVVNAGSRDGVAVDQPVVAAGGLAGRVIEVASTTAVVRLTADPEFVAGALLPGSGEAGIVRGTGDPALLEMELLNPLAPAEVGDPVVSYGSPGSHPFPPGLVIGEVADAGDPENPRRTLLIRPAPTLTGLGAVAVITETNGRKR